MPSRQVSAPALAGARHKAAKTAGWNLREDGLQGGHKRLVLYTSDQSHSSVQKAVELLGLGTRNLRAVPSDAAFRLRVDALEAAIEAQMRLAAPATYEPGDQYATAKTLVAWWAAELSRRLPKAVQQHA